MQDLLIKNISIATLPSEVEQLYKDQYQVSKSDLDAALAELVFYLDFLRKDLFVQIEYPYVDKVYRDSFYNYYASKRGTYERNAIRLSFFSNEVIDSDFRTSARLNHIKTSYLGFMVLRPTFPFIVGRGVLSPKACLSNDIIISDVRYSATVSGIKLDVLGFPHSSQDTETISCAETTVWSIMEYFGNRYPEYTPTLPSRVTATLQKFSFERLIPSKGLTAAQISYALKEFGFGVRIYSRNSYVGEYFPLFRIYIESGIPVVGILQNANGIGHALNIVGRKKASNAEIDGLPSLGVNSAGIEVFEFAQLDLEYVCVDDNYAPYRTCKLTTPASYYTDPKWAGCYVSSFIVPLYPKIYLEAGEARNITFGLINSFSSLGWITKKELLIKTFLASSRSWKNEIALNDTFDAAAKDQILSISLPKFIWVTELSDKSLFKAGNAAGLMILDATERNHAGMVAGLIEDHYIVNTLNDYDRIPLSLPPFKSYQNNLR